MNNIYDMKVTVKGVKFDFQNMPMAILDCVTVVLLNLKNKGMITPQEYEMVMGACTKYVDCPTRFQVYFAVYHSSNVQIQMRVSKA